MKTAMEKKETGLMRQIGYLSFVVVLLYGLTLFAVSCDNDEDPPLPPAVEKVVLAFGVDQGEGQLSAKPELENTAAEKIGELISPVEIAKGTTVHFRATHSKSWTIMYSKDLIPPCEHPVSSDEIIQMPSLMQTKTFLIAYFRGFIHIRTCKVKFNKTGGVSCIDIQLFV